MHPAMTHELARIKQAELLQYAATDRLARTATGNRPRSIDAVALGSRLHRTLLRLGHALRGAPAGAGA